MGRRRILPSRDPPVRAVTGAQCPPESQRRSPPTLQTVVQECPIEYLA
jgi:hypothetical protein